jgi:imidazolonepropionase-like amidohydrolase
MEERIGSLEPGKLADIVVVDGGLHGVEDVACIDVWLTVLDGTVERALEPSLLGEW